MCEREHTRTHAWRCAALMLGDRPKSSRGCLLKTAERGEQLSMAVDHSLTLQSAVDPPQDDNSKASPILCVWHTRLILGQIRFQPLSSSPFRFPLFLFFCFFCFTHMLSIHTSFWDLVVAGQEMLTVRKCARKRESSLTFCVFFCVLHHNKKTNKKKKSWSVSLPP